MYLSIDPHTVFSIYYCRVARFVSYPPQDHHRHNLAWILQVVKGRPAPIIEHHPTAMASENTVA